MTGRYKAYPEYKDSKSQWFGRIPIDWNISQLRRSLLDHKQGYYTTEAYVDDGIKLLRITDLCGDGLIDFSQCPKVPKEDPTLVNYKLENGDVVFARTGGAGSFGVVSNITENVVFASYLIRFRFCNDSFEANYLKYVLLADSFQKAVKQNVHGGVNQNIHAEDIKGTYLARPPKEQQQKIANFLDHETAKIDTLIAKQEKLIELLKEKRQAVISHAVTKGLNPDAPMKDSGVEWLGEVPEHWVVKRLKFSAKLLASKVAGTDARTIIALENIESSTGRYISTNSSYADDGVVAEAGDVLFGKLRPYLSKVFLCNEPSVAFGDLLAYRPKVGTVAQYLFYSMISGGFIEIVDSSTYGAKMPRASADFINEMRIALPPITEQETIVNQLKDDLSAFDALAVKANDAIKLMQERKTALISAAVTGKIDVSDWELKGDL
ncbi:TPA: restriction endonuclease subunit S [Vibrio vulnificus]|nr:restriction endonuclease subunit S [Vibrio vulnificus]